MSAIRKRERDPPLWAAVYSGDVALITKAVEAMDAHDAWHVEQGVALLPVKD